MLYAINLMDRKAYQFAPFAMAAAVFLAWHRLRLLTEPVEPGSRWQTRAIFGVAFAMLCLVAALWSPWLAVISALVTTLG